MMIRGNQFLGGYSHTACNRHCIIILVSVKVNLVLSSSLMKLFKTEVKCVEMVWNAWAVGQECGASMMVSPVGFAFRGPSLGASV